MTDFSSFAQQLGVAPEERQPRRGRVDLNGHAAALERRRSARGSIPLRPAPAMLRQAEIEAAHAQHELATVDETCPAERLEAVRRQAGEARARARRLRAALDGQ